MTTMCWWLVGILVYLIVGLILKNHTKIGTVQFKDYSIRFVFFYIIPLGGLAFYLISCAVYELIMVASDIIFMNIGGNAIDPNDFFVMPKMPKYPQNTDN